MNSFRILEGDALAVLRTLPAKSFDACLTDPPYGLSFMGKAWDHGVPASPTWAEVLRVLKPGAPLLAFGGTRTHHRLMCAIEDAGFAISDTLCWLYGSGFPKSQAQLKPAWEPITLAWKKGARVLAIDAARIGTQAVESGRAGRAECASIALGKRLMGTQERQESLGRWPANVILDEESAAALDLASGTSQSAARTGTRAGKERGALGAFAGQESVGQGHSDSGGASRFFYIAKADPSERGENTHPTVKPIDLCAYLAKLLLPPGGTRRLLVPFSGSGSEIIGALRAGWLEAVGIEISGEYAALSRNRIIDDSPMFTREASIADEVAPHSDEWCAALGAQDAIKEEALERA